MKKLEVKGTQEFLSKQIPCIEGGFGEGQKVVLARTVAEIHEVELKDINRLINDNIDEFEENIDILDLKNSVDSNHPLLELGFTKQSISNSKNIYLLSEQGYMALASLMRTEKAKEIRKQFRREYFNMRQVINSSEQLKAMALLRAVETNGAESVMAIKEYTNIRIQEETKPLIDKIEKQETIIDRVINDKGLYSIDVIGKILKPYSKEMGAKNIFKYLRKEKILIDAEYTHRHNLPYDKYREYFQVKQIEKETFYDIKTFTKTYFTGKGVKWFLNRLVKVGLLTNSQKDCVANEI